jgi:hypothetical protein
MANRTRVTALRMARDLRVTIGRSLMWLVCTEGRGPGVVVTSAWRAIFGYAFGQTCHDALGARFLACAVFDRG